MYGQGIFDINFFDDISTFVNNLYIFYNVFTLPENFFTEGLLTISLNKYLLLYFSPLCFTSLS